MITFETKNLSPKVLPTFKDVEFNQFFVNADGELCQKVCFDSYNLIASKNGSPLSHQVKNVRADWPIERFIEKIEKIKF